MSYTLKQAKDSSDAVGDTAHVLQFCGIVVEGENRLSWDQRRTIICSLEYCAPRRWLAN